MSDRSRDELVEDLQRRLDDAEGTIRALMTSTGRAAHGHGDPYDTGVHEVALPESAGRILAAIETIPTGFVLLDAQGCVLLMSEAGRQLWGLDAPSPQSSIGPISLVDRVLACDPRDPHTEARIPRGDLFIARALAGIAVQGAEMLVRRPGAVADSCLKVRAVPRRSRRGQITGVVCLFSDVTQERELTRALVASETRLRAMHAVMACGVLVVDDHGRVVECNDPAAAALGLTPREILGRGFSEFGSPCDEAGVPLAADPITVALRTRKASRNVSLGLQRRDQSICWVHIDAVPMLDPDGQATRVVASFIDVSDRVRAQRERDRSREQLARSEARLRKLLESLPDAVAVHADGRLLYVNRAFVRLAGADDPIALVGRTVTELLQGHEPPQPSEAERRLDEANGPPAAREESWRVGDGPPLTVEAASHVIEYDGALATLLVARDVTERKRWQARAMETDRLAAVGMLAAGVAHEINNPLAYVVANVTFATEELPAAIEAAAGVEPRMQLERVSEALGEAREGCDRVRAIVRDLGVLSRKDAGRVAPVDVRRVLHSACNMAWHQIRNRARLVKDLGEAPEVLADESRLAQVLLNLLVNAAQAIEPGDPDRHEIRVVVRTDPRRRVVVEVRDTGTGIPPEVIDRIFDPFFTLKPPGVGTGLGLSICRSIVDGMGGALTVTSELGRGSTFRIVLPSASGSSRDEARPPAAVGRPAGPRARVLVVDDEPGVGATVRRLLSRDHDVVVEASGQAALRRLTSDARFDIVLCDLFIPDLSGMALFERIRAELPETAERFVFITGASASAGARTFLAGVANPVLEKPFDVCGLRELVVRAATGDGVSRGRARSS